MKCQCGRKLIKSRWTRISAVSRSHAEVGQAFQQHSAHTSPAVNKEPGCRVVAIRHVQHYTKNSIIKLKSCSKASSVNKYSYTYLHSKSGLSLFTKIFQAALASTVFAEHGFNQQNKPLVFTLRSLWMLLCDRDAQTP